MSNKIILLGSINGHLEPVFTKLASLHAKNHFNFALIVGNLFSADQDISTALFSSNISIPLPTYFTVGSTPLPEEIINKIEKNEEIYPNLHFLEKCSSTTTSEGVKIVTLGGELESQIPSKLCSERYLPFHSVDQAKALHRVGTADILLTTSWPASIRKGSKAQLVGGPITPTEYEHVADLCAKIKPRYHISTSANFFFEREPFFHSPGLDAPNYTPVTRFISLASYGTPKQKSLYAFTLPSTVDPTISLPAGTTASPWSLEQNLKKRKNPTSAPDLENDSHGWNRTTKSRGSGRRWQRRPPPGPEECFFCLSNPKLATHLISSIGEEAYLTIAKGPLTTSISNERFGINFPAHALIIPFSHSPTISMITDENKTREKTYAEMIQFKNALQDMISKKSNKKLGAVTYEISSINGIHSHWQFVPIPEKTIREGLVEAAFRAEAENLLYPPIEIRDPGLGLSDGNFFRAWIWTPSDEENSRGITKCIILPFSDDFKFSLQYGRNVLAKLLNLEDRIQWRDCAQSEEEEKKDIENFKAAFKDFDFTL
ncbi:hypothetical protein K3495_g4416 [Podosphaera aphanis]|nr:hypothetical protein K3495_g4416 [Podosphaera aphanis]